MMMVGDVAHRVREMVHDLWTKNGVEIIVDHVLLDHAHQLLLIPPQVKMNLLLQRLRGKISNKPLHEPWQFGEALQVAVSSARDPFLQQWQH